MVTSDTNVSFDEHYMENHDKYFQDWRKIRGVWHYIEHFPGASQMGSFCGLFRPYGLFDEISKDLPEEGEICDTCKTCFIGETQLVEELKAKADHRSKDSCTCQTCVDMCKRRPCWPTPEEARQLIDKGYGQRLMRDWYCCEEEDSDHFYLLCPAIVDYEGEDSPFWPFGMCTFLKYERCELHDLGLKPGEGKEAWCQEDDKGTLHVKYAQTWKNPEAQQLVKEWEQIYYEDLR
jgi:hypothetical protein